MGRIKKNGNIGRLSGTVGDVVVSEWNNIPVVRSRPVRSTKPATQSQIDQQVKMRLAGKFLKTIKKVLKPGFREFAVKMSGYNAALKQLLLNAITGQHPVFAINFSKVYVTKGLLLNEADASATVASDVVTFTWKYVPDEQLAAPRDKAILVVYCEALNKSVYTLGGAERSTGTATISVARFKGHDVHTWLAFISADGLNVSDSIYTGQVTAT